MQELGDSSFNIVNGGDRQVSFNKFKEPPIQIQGPIDPFFQGAGRPVRSNAS